MLSSISSGQGNHFFCERVFSDPAAHRGVPARCRVAIALSSDVQIGFGEQGIEFESGLFDVFSSAFLAVDDDPLRAAATALAFFGLTGEVAGKMAAAPGSFMIQMLDALYNITPDELHRGCKIEAI